MRRRIVLLCIAVVASVVAGGASAAPSLRASLQTAGHTVTAGDAWAYYLQVWQGKTPWRGTIEVVVRRPNGRTVDDVGRFPVVGSFLHGYLWNQADSGTYDFTVALTENGKTLRTVVYPVLVQHA